MVHVAVRICTRVQHRTKVGSRRKRGGAVAMCNRVYHFGVSLGLSQGTSQGTQYKGTIAEILHQGATSLQFFDILT